MKSSPTNAVSTPSQHRPKAELHLTFQDESAYLKAADEMGLTAEEARLAEKQLKRRPNRVELGMLSAMWSEHCSYKSSRALLRQLPTKGPKVLQGPGENAGIVDLGDEMALCFKIESHNHPSYIEPYQGAATGVGGILRDIFTMGARPIAFMNSLRFGDTSEAHMRHLLKGVVKGIGGYGNCVGIPTVGGEVAFDPAYQGNILVNAFCAGVLRKDKIFRAKAQGVGNLVVYIGSKTGRDGIHGASMASDSFDEAALERRPTVQVGDPFTGKLVMEATLEMLDKGLVLGIQDMGAAGLTCSIVEMSDKGKCGMEVELSLVPMREIGMDPFEILLSESQERMLLVCEPDKKDAIFAVARHWGIDASVIGKVVEGDRVQLKFHGELVVDLPPSLLTDNAPIYNREIRPPQQVRTFEATTDQFAKGKDAGEWLLRLLGSPNNSSRSWVYHQYDHQVGTNVVNRPGGDAALVRLKGKSYGIAMSCDGNSFYCAADPYRGAKIAVMESARNLACVGAEPLAVTNCLNFGNPERTEIMWELDQVIKGMRDACNRLGIPVISGNVSLYNQHDEDDIPPTPVIVTCGVRPHLEHLSTSHFSASGHEVLLLGATAPSKKLTGEIAQQLHPEQQRLGTHERRWPVCPELEMDLELALQKTVRSLVQEGVVVTAHDCADGGLAVALAECCGGEKPHGATLQLEGDWNALDLFTEETSRVIVACTPQNSAKVVAMAKANGCPCVKLGVTGGEALKIDGKLNVPVAALSKARAGYFKEVGGA